MDDQHGKDSDPSGTGDNFSEVIISGPLIYKSPVVAPSVLPSSSYSSNNQHSEDHMLALIPCNSSSKLYIKFKRYGIDLCTNYDLRTFVFRKLSKLGSRWLLLPITYATELFIRMYFMESYAAGIIVLIMLILTEVIKHWITKSIIKYRNSSRSVLPIGSGMPMRRNGNIFYLISILLVIQMCLRVISWIIWISEGATSLHRILIVVVLIDAFIMYNGFLWVEGKLFSTRRAEVITSSAITNPGD